MIKKHSVYTLLQYLHCKGETCQKVVFDINSIHEMRTIFAASTETSAPLSKTLMGPIYDEHGVEQGGAKSGDL